MSRARSVWCVSAQLCPTLCDPMNCSPPDSSVHGILQARILEWIATLFSRGSSQPRDRTLVSYTAGRFFTIWATQKKKKPPRVTGIYHLSLRHSKTKGRSAWWRRKERNKRHMAISVLSPKFPLAENDRYGECGCRAHHRYIPDSKNHTTKAVIETQAAAGPGIRKSWVLITDKM